MSWQLWLCSVCLSLLILFLLLFLHILLLLLLLWLLFPQLQLPSQYRNTYFYLRITALQSLPGNPAFFIRVWFSPQLSLRHCGRNDSSVLSATQTIFSSVNRVSTQNSNPSMVWSCPENSNFYCCVLSNTAVQQ